MIFDEAGIKVNDASITDAPTINRLKLRFPLEEARREAARALFNLILLSMKERFQPFWLQIIN